MNFNDYIFRGMTKNNREWVCGSLINVPAHNFCCILPDDDGTDYEYPYLDNDLGCIDGYVYPVFPETVGIYTGWTDKNEFAIFTGDIVKIVSKDLDSQYIGVVVFKDGCFCIKYQSELDRKFGDGRMTYHQIGKQSETRMMGCTFYIGYTYEVLGNVHDNDELVKQILGN